MDTTRRRLLQGLAVQSLDVLWYWQWTVKSHWLLFRTKVAAVPKYRLKYFQRIHATPESSVIAIWCWDGYVWWYGLDAFKLLIVNKVCNNKVEEAILGQWRTQIVWPSFLNLILLKKRAVITGFDNENCQKRHQLNKRLEIQTFLLYLFSF